MIERGLDEMDGQLHSVFRPRMHGYAVQRAEHSFLDVCTHGQPKTTRVVRSSTHHAQASFFHMVPVFCAPW
jgi:polyribonucleotide nucleotidyltransferase